MPQTLAHAIEPALDLRPDRAARAVESLRDLVDLEALRVAQTEDLAIGLGERREHLLHLAQLRVSFAARPVAFLGRDRALPVEAVVVAQVLANRRVAHEHAQPPEQPVCFRRCPAQRLQERLLDDVVRSIGSHQGADAPVQLRPKSFEPLPGQAKVSGRVGHARVTLGKEVMSGNSPSRRCCDRECACGRARSSARREKPRSPQQRVRRRIQVPLPLRQARGTKAVAVQSEESSQCRRCRRTPPA